MDPSRPQKQPEDTPEHDTDPIVMLHRAEQYIDNIEKQDGPEMLENLMAVLAIRVTAEQGLRGISLMLSTLSGAVHQGCNVIEAAEVQPADD
jgi:hypothetical protein